MTADVPLVITQGEDFTAQVIWTDNFDEPIEVVHPCRMEVRNGAGQTLLTLETNPSLAEGEIPEIGLSSELGLIQLHIPRATTAALLPGVYVYDLFVTADDGDESTTPQVTRLFFGPVTVNKRITRMT